MRLTSSVVLELAQLRAKIKALQQKEEDLCLDIKDRMIELEIDEFAPTAVPMKLVKLEYDQTKGFWRAMAENAFKGLYGPRWRVHLEQQREKFPRKHIVSIHIAAGNENYKAVKK